MKWSSFLLLLLCSVATFAQQDSIVIQENVQELSVDPFSNIYVITDQNEFKKYNNKGEFEYTHSDLELSETSELATDHAFKSMIYYPDFELIRVFGNRLQLLAELNLTEFTVGEITAAAPSVGYQSFWVFDATAQRLLKINQQYQTEIEGDELSAFTQTPFFPTIIKEREGWVYAYDPENGFFVFDIFGTFSTFIEVKEGENFSVFNDFIYLYKGSNIIEIDTKLKLEKELETTIEGDVLDMAYRKIVVANGDKIEVLEF